MRQLSRIENNHNVEIIFAIESGSRAWNIQSEDSDYDVRGVFVHDSLAEYLKVASRGEMVIEQEKELTPALLSVYYQNEVQSKSLVGTEIDITLWNLRKYLRLAEKGNAQAREWADSPILYKRTKRGRHVIDKIPMFWNPLEYSHHYIGLATGNYKRYIEDCEETVPAKKYIYITRAICQARRIWESEGHYKKTSFDAEKISHHIQDPVARSQFIEILNEKVSGKELESVDRSRFSDLDAWIRDNIGEEGHAVCEEMPTGRDDKSQIANRIFQNILGV